ncbi:XRE family transcriptional regulator [Paenibacillus chitinolyticus]|uniref:Helix-turn-helix domain-containing protein n=1 Tax=Paenibacillus chitinolyticus TaxID=79263 RepID=A0A410WY10_9BACL|nr:helix-turn-helix transcriptional regulator [Paenibacillus chitinolyticus]MCY9589846.1 helix-turn-helix domain-containing protein [Paenibacillus chitinolyticus]MCY9598153.1 helix-turn-helix domain-containing protein [Paenibacillus chitinolyticus]QAV19220.1 XRE family transcriptional regulator [Paenibacillus chitinolyticus]
MEEEEFYQWLGQYVKNIRKQRNKTQVEISSIFRLSRSSLANIETGRHRISCYTLYELLCALDHPFNDVLDSIPTLPK